MNIKLIVAFLACLSLGAQEDPGGWTKAKWGMTQAQVLQVFPEAHLISYSWDAPRRKGDRRPEDPPRVFFGLEHLTIGASPITYIVEFTFKAGALESVKIENDQRARHGASSGLLLSGLREKYGEPVTVTTERPFSFVLLCNWEWMLPQTVITLHTNEMPTAEIDTLTYRHRVKNDQL